MENSELPKIVSKLKICGVTNSVDVQVCLNLGVDFVGFNLEPTSKRFVTSADALKYWQTGCVKNKQYQCRPVLVLVDPSLTQLESIIRDWQNERPIIQLHGQESVVEVSEFREQFSRTSFWKVLPVKDSNLPEFSAYMDNVELLLFDTATGSAFGGTGSKFDWRLLRDFRVPIPWGVAGGITPDNVSEALQFSPFLIDICSGVEKEAGKKDHDKIASVVRKIASR